MKLKRLIKICSKSENPVKIIVSGFYFDGGGEAEYEETLTFITTTTLKDREVEFYSFEIREDEIVCVAQLI